MYTQESVKAQVIQIISDKLSMPAEHIQISSDFKDLGADSLHVVEIIMTLEETFGVIMKDEDVEKLRTVGEVIELIQRLKISA